MPGPIPYLQEQGVEHQAPGCPITVSYDTHTLECLCLLDSGAEYTSVPDHIVTAFSLERRGEIDVEGATGVSEAQGLYRINLEFLGFVYGYHLVIGGTGPAAQDYVLIGRDILNRHQVILAGPQQQFSID